MKRKIIKAIILYMILQCNIGCSSNNSDGGLVVPETEEVFSSIEIMPENKSYIVGNSYQMQAVIHLSDGSTTDITESAIWISSDPLIANMVNTTGSKGLLSCLALGKVTISAEYDGITETAIITIVEEELNPLGDNVAIIFLDHSTGHCIWQGGVPDWFNLYNNDNAKNYSIDEQAFPKSSPYGWNNYPYDYWNIWVEHAGDTPYMDEPTLEMLTRNYNVVIWKHCFPVSSILEDSGHPSIESEVKAAENYRLQYAALKEKMHEFPDTRFIVWTGAARVEGATTSANAIRAREFFEWVKNDWDDAGDNIFIWDFFELETEGGLYLRNEYAASLTDSHPNATFSQMAAPYLCQRIVDVIEGRGDTASVTGH